MIASGIFENQPPWFAEGLASYFETTNLDPGATHVKIGLPSEDDAEFLLTRSPISIAKLFACKEFKCMDNAFYATSWAVFSFLLNVHTVRFIDYMRRLQRAPRGTEAEVWRRAFPDLPPDAIDPLLKKWLVSGPIAVPLIAVPVVTAQAFPSTRRQLGDGDVLAARSLLQLWFRQNVPAARADVTAALAIERTNVLARLVHAAITESIDPDEARATAAAHPDDWRAWWLVASAVQQGPEAAEARDKLCALSANQALECDHAGPQGAPDGASE